jgi:predicted nucleotidyltransferase
MDKIKNLITVQHGSHLYGMAHAHSDIDLYTVYDFLNKKWRPRRQVKQHIEGETDQVKISLDKFTEQVCKGVPQALEVLFSRQSHWLDYAPEWNSVATNLRYELDLPTVLDTYRRTVMNFFANDDFKKNRHGFRLLLNANALKNNGHFDPTLTESEIARVTEYAERPWSLRQEKYKDLLWEVFG